MILDRLAHSNRWQGRHPGEKGLFVAGLLAITLFQPPLIAAPVVLLVTGVAAVVGAGIPLGFFLRVLALPAGFLLLGAPVLLLSVDTSAGLTLNFAAQGVRLVLEVTARSLAAFSCLLLFAMTTPVTDWLPLLARVGVPGVVVELVGLIYAFFFLLIDTAAAIAKAQSARLGYGGFRHGLRDLGQLIAMLLPLAMDRAMRLEAGLAARGFEGRLPVLHRLRPLSPAILVAIPLFVGLLAGGIHLLEQGLL